MLLIEAAKDKITIVELQNFVFLVKVADKILSNRELVWEALK